MERSSLSDIYTCRVCGMKIHLKILTEHVLLHEEYSAFSYNEVTKIIEPLDDPQQQIFGTETDSGDSSTANEHVLPQQLQQQQQFIPQMWAPGGSVPGDQQGLVDTHNPIQPKDGRQKQWITETATDFVPHGKLQPAKYVVENLNDPSAHISVMPIAGLSGIHMTPVDHPGDFSSTESSSDDLIQIHKELSPGDVIGSFRLPLIVNGGVQKYCQCSIVFNEYVEDEKRETMPRNMSSLEDIIDDGEPLDDYGDLEEALEEERAGRRVSRRSTARSGRLGIKMEVYKYKDTAVNSELQKELQKNLGTELLKNEAVVKYLETISGEPVVVEEKNPKNSVPETNNNVGTDPVKTSNTVEEHIEDDRIRDVKKETELDESQENTAEPQQTGISEGGEQKPVSKKTGDNYQGIVTLCLTKRTKGNQRAKKKTKTIEIQMTNRKSVSVKADSHDSTDCTDADNDDEEQELNDLESVQPKSEVAIQVQNSSKISMIEDKTNNSASRSPNNLKDPDTLDSNANCQETDSSAPVPTKLQFFCNRCEEKIQLRDLKHHLSLHNSNKNGNESGCKERKDSSGSETLNEQDLGTGKGKLGSDFQGSKHIEGEQKSDGTSQSEDTVTADSVEEDDPEDESDIMIIDVVTDNRRNLRKKRTVSKRKLEADEDIRSKRKRQNGKTTIRNNYICENCGTGFFLKTKYFKHSQHCVDKSVPKCFQGCGYLFKTISELDAHKRFCSRRIEYLNRVQREFLEDRNLIVNEDGTAVKTEIDYHCPYCNEEFHSEEYYENHRLRCREGTLRQCHLCEFVSKDELSINKHLAKVHDAKPYQCSVCNETFKHRQELTTHKSSHLVKSGPESAECKHCGQKFETETKCYHHMLVCPSRPVQKCEHCDFQCKGDKPMTYHLVHVHNLKPFQCEHCDKQFRLKGSLKDHMKVAHTKEAYTCETCGKSFIKQSFYRSHVSIQHEGFRFTCSYCGKKYKDKKTWRVHEQSHKGAYEYSCTMCKQTFGRSGLYKDHMKEMHNIEGEAALALNKTAKELREKLCTNVCSICKETFPVEEYYHIHMLKEHGQDVTSQVAK